jgi:4-hydroxybenzoate polyprenyltransferase
MTAKAIFRLLRIPNLLLMAFTMYSFRFFVIIPILRFSGSSSAVQEIYFFLIVLSVLLIAAGGYVINDYYDIEIDSVNKPEKMVVGAILSKEKAYLLFHFLSFTGILLSFFLSFFAGIKYIAIIHTGCALLLWLYAWKLKKILLAGNILISLLCVVTMFVTVIYDDNAWKAEPVKILLAGYCTFAFLMSFIREMIKDMEDIKGDLAGGCQTLPIVTSQGIAKAIVAAFILITIILLAYVQLLQCESNDLKSMSYITVMLQVPLVYLLIRVVKSDDKAGFHFCSLFAKLIMLAGILSMPVFYLSFTN